MLTLVFFEGGNTSQCLGAFSLALLLVDMWDKAVPTSWKQRRRKRTNTFMSVSQKVQRSLVNPSWIYSAEKYLFREGPDFLLKLQPTMYREGKTKMWDRIVGNELSVSECKEWWKLTFYILITTIQMTSFTLEYKKKIYLESMLSVVY